MIDEIKAALKRAKADFDESTRIQIHAEEWLEHLIERVESAEREAERVTRAAEIELEKFAGIGSRIQYRNDELVEENAKLRERVEKLEAKLERTKEHWRRQREETEMIEQAVYSELDGENEKLRAELAEALEIIAEVCIKPYEDTDAESLLSTLRSRARAFLARRKEMRLNI